MMIATLCAMYANTHRGEDDRSFTTADFMFMARQADDTKPQTVDEQNAVLQRMARLMQQ